MTQTFEELTETTSLLTPTITSVRFSACEPFAPWPSMRHSGPGADALVWALTELSENRRPPGGLFMSVNL
jgi:hypothetical protein